MKGTDNLNHFGNFSIKTRIMPDPSTENDHLIADTNPVYGRKPDSEHLFVL
jgi:hypothetical protein